MGIALPAVFFCLVGPAVFFCLVGLPAPRKVAYFAYCAAKISYVLYRFASGQDDHLDRVCGKVVCRHF